jgi:hypothetical protein
MGCSNVFQYISQQNNVDPSDLLNQLGRKKSNVNLEKEINWIVSTRLCHEARSLDVETPPVNDEEMWYSDYGQRVWLTPKGRAQRQGQW